MNPEALNPLTQPRGVLGAQPLVRYLVLAWLSASSLQGYPAVAIGLDARKKSVSTDPKP